MKKSSIALVATVIGVSGCAAAGSTKTVKPPAFECKSIHPEVCALEEQFHQLRFEQAEQNAAIERAERRRKAYGA